MSRLRKKVLKRCISMLAISLMFATTLAAQSANRIALTKERITLSEIFKEIERQSNFVVVVNPNKIDRNKEVVMTRTEGTVGEILDSALSDFGQSYQINGRYIVVVSGEKKKEEPLAQQKTAPLPDNGYVPSYMQQAVPAGFEREASSYTDRSVNNARNVAVRYDTIRYNVSDNGLFSYPDRTAHVKRTRREIIRSGQSYLLDTPPVFAIKTNLLYWATGTPNLAFEIGLGKKTSLDLMAGYNPWNLDGTFDDNKKMVHWMVRPEFRYWLCERFNGHFFGLHAFYWKYNISERNIPMLFDKEFRYQGNAFGAGLSYGYHWAWSKHWGMEFNIGAGLAFLDYTKKDCVKCGHEVGEYKKTYFGPTNLGIKLLFVAK